MMKKFFKERSGLTLVTLSIAVIIILIITSTIIYNMTSNLGIGRLRDMQNDIKNLRSKVADYYAEYDDIPARKDVQYTNIGHLRSAGIISDAVDTGNFYVIELSSLDNLTLTYGQDYEKLKNGSVTDPNSLNDIYIINEDSHNIFYVQGVELDDEWFYTDYTSDQIDTQKVDRHMVEGVIIPAGFYYVGGTKEEGIVISDVQGDDLENSKGGNQFVWVPVDNYEDFQRQEGYFKDNPQSDLSSSGEVDSTGVNENENGDKVEETETTKQEAKAMYESVKKYKGFFIGRFETGNKDEQAVVSKGVSIYNNIPWSSTGTMQEDEAATEGGAIELSRAFDSANGYTNVTSTLCYSVQWDAALNFIDSNYISNASIGSPNCAEDSYVRNSDGKGWYGQSNATNTGYYQIKNIYDLAGNVYEWTMESYNTRFRETRGGGYTASGSGMPSSIRANRNPSTGISYIGFRICLFINVPEEPLEVVDGVTVPKDFTHLEGNTKEEGIVVADSLGNEYVWVPVTKDEDGNPTEPYKSTNGKLRKGSDIEIQLGRYTFNTSTGVPSTYTGTDYKEEDLENENISAISIDEFKDSVYINGGYYIARYEAGVEDGKWTSIENSEGNPDWTGYTGENIKLVSKSGATVWNFITQNRAAYLCEELADVNGYSGVASDLINSYAWDTAIVYIQECGTDNNYSNQAGISKVEIEASKAGEAILAQGNGVGKNDVQCNIYDMAGNCLEWTTETYYSPENPCVYRGGFFNYSQLYASSRGSYDTISGNQIISFRPLLYFSLD